ncbi:MAG TPA: POTRA domain-containing protein [Polyangia bacterium]|nr:POTRA domain-containing protein [Polyangia bacterium]
MPRSGRTVLLVLQALTSLLWAACAHEAADGRSRVHDVRVSGCHALSERELLDGLVTHRSGLLGAPGFFDPAALDVDLERVQSFYALHGYFDARVVGQEVRARRDGSVDVIIRVNEGAATHIEELVVEGLAGVRGADVDRALALAPGQVFDHARYEAAKQDLLEQLRSHGYAYAHVGGEVLIDRERHAARVRLTAAPGPQVHFGEPRFVGNGDLPEHALARRVTWQAGEIYHPEDLHTTEARLYDLGVFSSVRLDLPLDPQPVANVTIAVEPGPLHALRLGGGAGIERQRYEARGRVELSWRNFLGGLRTLRLKLRPAYVVVPSIFDPKQDGFAADADLELVQPDLLKTNLTARALVGYDLGLQEGFRYHGPRLQAGLERPWFHDHFLLGGSWNLQYLNFFDIDPEVFDPSLTPLGLGFVNPYRVAWLEELAQLELRDRPLDPRAGAYLAVRAEEGLPEVGSDFSYFKLTPEARGYMPVSPRIVLALRGLLGWLRPDGGDSPVTRRYALGGPSSHRGFGFGRLAPQVLDMRTNQYIPVGGNGELLLSLEGRLDLFRAFGNWIELATFVDAGDVTPRVEELDLSDLHVAAGGSIEYHTPIGHFRGGIGVRLNRLEMPNPDPGERLAFHISVGEAF